jgi:hypothetical protein
MSHSARWFTEKLEEFTGGNKSEQIHMNQTVIYNFINLPPDVVLESTKWTNNGPKTIEQVHLITILVGPSFSISSELTIKQSNLSKLVYVGYVGNHDPTCSPFFLTCAYSGMGDRLWTIIPFPHSLLECASHKLHPWFMIHILVGGLEQV